MHGLFKLSILHDKNIMIQVTLLCRIMRIHSYLSTGKPNVNRVFCYNAVLDHPQTAG